MHIVFDGIAFSLQAGGGVSACFRYLIEELVKLDQRVTLLTYPGAARNVHLRELVELLPADARFSIRKRAAWPVVERVLDCRGIPRDTDVFHSTYYRLPSSPPSRAAIITTVHDFIHERAPPSLRRRLFAAQKRRAILGADAVACVSGRTAALLPVHVPAVAAERIWVVPNGVGKAFRPVPEAAVVGALARLRVQRPYVLFVGRRDSYKNFPMAVSAVQAAGDVNFVIIGGGDLSPSERSALATLAESRRRKLDWVTEPDLNALYNGALALLYPSAEEGFGIPVAEAMSAGCPPIVTPGVVAEEIGVPADLSSARTAIEMAGLVRRLRAASGFGASVRQACLTAAARCSWTASAKKLLLVYERTLARRGP